MITVLSCTNRKNSNSVKIAQVYVDTIQSMTSEDVQLLDLADLPIDMFHSDMYSADHQSPALRAIQEKLMIPAQKFVFVAAEYNGSISGALKLFIDACSVYKMKETFKVGTKKAAIAGISSGRAGNLRGMIHLTGMLNYLNIQVLANQLPISGIDGMFDADKNFVHEGTLALIEAQCKEFLDF